MSRPTTPDQPQEPGPATEPPTTAWRRGGLRVRWGLAGVGAAVAGWLLLGGGERVGFGGAAALASDPSVAVLPFENLSPDPENEYFASGIHDELLTHLSQIQDLRVISRTTMLRYANTDKSVRDIARELDVRTVLEGSVRRMADHVRISFQLIDGRTDAPLWVETYDREITDVLAVQSDVARAVARALEAELTPREEEGLARRPTDDADAYQFYLRGTDWLRRGNTDEYLRNALGMFERALDLDPGFAEAWAGLSSAHLDLYWYDHDPTADRLSEGRAAAERALDLAPSLPAARMAMAIAYYRARDFARSLALTEGVLREAPSYPEVPFRIAAIYRRQGRWEESTRIFERAVALDPMNGEKITNLALNYAVLHRFTDAEETFKRSIAAAPDGGPSPYLNLGDVYLGWTGDMRSARDAVSRIPDAFAGSRSARLAYYDAVEGRYDEALERIVTVQDRWVAFGPVVGGPPSLLEALLRDAIGGSEDVAGLYDEAVGELEELAARERADPGPGRTNARSALALAYAGMGESERAIETALEAVEALPLTQDAFWGADRLLALAYVFAATGRYGAAVETLDRLLAVPTRYTASWLRLDPFLAPLRGQPGFEALVRRADAQGPRAIVS